MTFLPIVARELRVLSRKRSTYWVRSGAALGIVAAGTWMFLMMQRESPQDVSKTLFGLLTVCAGLFCLFSGVRSTADSLSHEKREGTLGLLFLTDLKGYDVVLGKLAATSVNGLYSVLAVMPMMAVPLLIGGISLAQFGRASLMLIDTLFFSLSVGMFVSAFSRRAQKAAMMTMMIILLVSIILPAAGLYYTYAARLGPRQTWLLLPSPCYAYFLAWDTPFATWKNEFWDSLIVIFAMGSAALILAMIVAPRSWQDRPAGVRKLRWRERWQLWSFGTLAQRHAFRTRLLDTNAFFWLAGRARLKPAFVWFVLGLIGCGWFWGWMRFHREWLNEGVFIMTGVVLNLLLKGWFVSEAGRQLAEDRKSGSLELLLSTSLTVRDIVRGQFLALARQFLGPVILVLCVELLFLAGLHYGELGENKEIWITFWLLSMVGLLFDLAALFWVGIWQGITAKNPNQAASATLMQIMILPPISFGLVCLLAVLSAARGNADPTWKFFMGWWFGLGFAADLIFGGRARLRVLTDFRVMAAQRYNPKVGFWKRLFSGERAEG